MLLTLPYQLKEKKAHHRRVVSQQTYYKKLSFQNGVYTKQELAEAPTMVDMEQKLAQISNNEINFPEEKSSNSAKLIQKDC